MHAAIALGSNLPSDFGDPSANLREALHRLSALGKVVAVSSFHETAPVGYTDQPHFVNAAALVETSLPPAELLQGMLAVEAAMGRVRSADQPPKGPRIIDLDLLLCADDQGIPLTHAGTHLALPHPEMHRRAFVLAPLAEIAPDLLHPQRRRTVQQMWDDLYEPSTTPES